MMPKLTIQELWDDFAKTLSPTISAEDRIATRISFYAGAAAFLMLAIDLKRSKVSTEVGQTIMKRLDAELKAFANDVITGNVT